MSRLVPLLAALLLPLESSALTRQNPHSGSLFSSEWETCRNDPVNNSDPLGLFSWSGFGRGVWDVVSEPVKAVSDTFVLAPMIGINNVLFKTKLALEDVEFNSMLAGGTRERRLAGASGLRAMGQGYGEFGLAVGTVGIYPLGKNLGENLGYYVEGDITLEELDYRLSHGAGGQAGGAALASATSAALGGGWLGRGAGPSAPVDQGIRTQGNVPLVEQVKSLPDDSLVSLSGRPLAEIRGNPTSFWFRWADVKHLTPKQYETVAGRYPLNYLHVTEQTKAFIETPKANAFGIREFETEGSVTIQPGDIFKVQE